ncbi:WASH complex subunit 2 isoform X2 [Leptopilina boulardi]|nr:WASH complex subunit 2 isoform X2 [Leptopilina boulardi]
MRNKRREWNLAGDAGLLKHLQRFSENLTTKANETTEALDSLTNRLNETAIFVDNLTNTSLALANTQFIESRVQEDDDVEIDKSTDQIEKNTNDQELNPADIIAIVNESIKEGLRIIDEKYDKVDVVASDSEDEGENILPSVILRAKDPYQDRPLPYVIGTEKWKSSIKIGLESSSSESEQMEEDEEESSSDGENKGMDLLNVTNRQTTLGSQLSSSSESNDYNLDSNSTRDTNNGSLRAKSQDTLNIESEPLTPTSVLPKSQNINSGPPSFAEELAKRLGSVLPIQKTVITQEAHDPSINRAKDDLFSQEDDEDVFSSKSENLFNEEGGSGLFDDDVPPKWNKSLPKAVKTNIIPSSIDVPPPISSTSTKAKSAFDDLFGDADSDDSDDIFSTKNTKKNIFSNDNSVKEGTNKKFLNSDFMENIGNMSTNVPEIHEDVEDLFADEEIDEDDLFNTSKAQSRIDTTPVDNSTQKKPIGGVSVLHGMDFRSSKLSTKIFRQSSSDSSGSESENSDTVESKSDFGISKNLSSTLDERSAENSKSNLETTIDGCGISKQSSSTKTVDLGADFQPQMTSNRLKSEERNREKIASDSLFTTTTRVQENITQDDIFDDEDDVFGPPPLPKANEKSKVISLFDDSDTDDELFASAIPKHHSQKIVDLKKLQSQEKPKITKNISIFDDDDDDEDNDDDIFAVNDSPDVDIFSIDTKPLNLTANESSTRKTSDLSSDLFGESGQNESPRVVKKPPATSLINKSIFYDSDEDDDLFGSILPKKGTKVSSIFDDSSDIDSLKSILEEKDTNKEKINNIEPLNKASDLSNIFQTNKSALFDDEMDDDDLFGHKTPLSFKDSNKTKSEDSAIMKQTTSEIIESKELSIEAKVSNIESKKMPPIIPQKPDSLKTKGNAIQETGNKMENVVDGCCISKSDPPNTLNIRSLSALDDGKEPPRRAVSGKIKNLLGKMGDLKILSPTDTPPVLRKHEEKNDEEESLECDSEDGGSLSITSSGKETSISAEDRPRKDSSDSMLTDEINTEKAISFDEPVHVETLINASKSRARIQVKRRPQSRQARQIALRQSGIDFDAVDSMQDLDDDIKIKDHIFIVDNINDMNLSSERLLSIKSDNVRNTELNLSLTIDDKSERTLSKESTNKNTLLSPSTDEEDLFDVPPDLPEDPFKEDSLFGRAPILSPIDDDDDDDDNDNVVVTREEIKSVKINTATTSVAKLKADRINKESIKSVDKVEKELKPDQKLESTVVTKSTEPDSKDVFSSEKENKESPLDPLRNKDLDPLKDPSQLFAFVTKTPSPEKGKALLFHEDDSLFSSVSNKKTTTINEKSTSKKMDSLFDDDDGDLFSTTIGKNNKKLLKDTKINLFDDDESLFGSSTIKKSEDGNEAKKLDIVESQSSTGEKNIFESDSDEHLFSDGTRATIPNDVADINKKKSNLNDIFGDQSSGEEDIFAFKKPISKKSTVESKSLFDDDDDDTDDDNNGIFGKTSSSLSKNKESHNAVKKVIKRDLKKTAEQIIEDPLSMLQDD